MKPDPIEIELAGTRFKIRPLLVAQHVEIAKLLKSYDKTDETSGLAINAEILKVVFERDYKDSEVEVTSLDELNQAVTKILSFAGFISTGAPVAGQGQAGEKQAA